jgi:hypothetical protein
MTTIKTKQSENISIGQNEEKLGALGTTGWSVK